MYVCMYVCVCVCVCVCVWVCGEVGIKKLFQIEVKENKQGLCLTENVIC